MGGIKSRIIINIFIERVKSHLIFFFLKYNKNEGRNIGEENQRLLRTFHAILQISVLIY